MRPIEWGIISTVVMPGLVPGIHVLASLKQERRGWPGRSPAMTKSESFSNDEKQPEKPAAFRSGSEGRQAIGRMQCGLVEQDGERAHWAIAWPAQLQWGLHMSDSETISPPHSSEYFGEERDYFWNTDYLDLLARRLGLGTVSSLADIGCGIGHWSLS